ncbi:MAG: ion channel [Chitinophagaceae bacterium]
MAIGKHVNPFSKSNNDTGFGINANNYGGRFVNKDGSFNLQKEGLPLLQRFSIYHSMLNMPRWKFIGTIIIFFILINIFYTLIYLITGIDQLQGFITTTEWGKIKELFFFSTETFTTVGYGRINPVGDGANIISSFEAMSGFLSFAIATGLIYGRFSKPKAYLAFSEHALITPYHDKMALMFRVASYKDNHTITNAEIKVSTALMVQENGNSVFKFYELPLERSRVDSLTMNWTVVHPIDENSPLLDFNFEDMKAADLEVYVLVRGFDDVYSNTVLKRTSYTFEEIKFNVKFVQMYHESEDGKTTILELDKLGKYKEVQD